MESVVGEAGYPCAVPICAPSRRVISRFTFKDYWPN